MEFYSQYGQDDHLYEKLFRDKTDGFFVDVGASDGVTISNSYFFEKFLGWNGICIEPRVSIIEELRKNRTCFIENVCISDTNEDEVEFLEICGYGQGLSGMKKKYDPRHVNRIKEDLKAHTESTSEVRKVKTVRLDSLLEKYNITHVDYLSIDVEGAELDIIKTIDFGKITITALTLENNYNDPAIRSFMDSKGFDLNANLGVDEVYFRRL